MSARHFILGFFGCLGFFGFFATALAAMPTLTLQHEHFLFILHPSDMRGWQTPEEQWMYKNRLVVPPASFRIDGDAVPPPPPGWERRIVTGWNRGAIADTVRRKIAAAFDRPAGSVTISKSGSGAITFDGRGLPGRRVEIDATTELVIQALERGIDHITLPITESPPAVTVASEELQAAGIREFVTVGESDYSGSPVNRRHNIGVGVARFNGSLIPQGADFSFNKILGRVDASTGYRKELVIKGERTEPDYGGGLCQVSTTAYRGVWEAGFPILKRRNHSFAVHYYGPQGTDATVYPGSIDMAFKNDSPGALLIQSFTEGTNAYFVYYGTRDARESEVVGPYTWGFKEAPPPRTEKTLEIPPGETKKVGSPVPGMQAMWFRVVRRDGEEKVEQVSSIYEARPLYHLVGVTPEAMPTAGSGETIIPIELP